MKSLKTFGLLAILTIAFGISALAQLTGTKNIPGDYADLAAAVTDLNTQGVGAGGVTLNLVAGNPQTSPAGGYSITTLTGTGANPITIQGNANTITAPTTHTVGALNDSIFKIIGADFVTITGFTMLENAANTTTTAATNNMTEWGVALLYATTTNGAQNNTIQGNTITLNRTYQNTWGIYSNSTHSATAPTTSATATTTAGGNSGLKIYGNTISNVNQGVLVIGPTAAADNNTGVDIGGTGGVQANSITNWGTTSTFSVYANVSTTVNGILVRNSTGFNVSFNTLTSSVGGTTVGTLNGIQIPAFSNAPTGTFTNNINSNTISLQSGLIAGAINGINIPGTSATATSILNVNNNNFTALNHTVAGTAAIQGIVNVGSTAGPLTHSISGNTFTNLTANTTGSFTFISNTWTRPTNGTGNINNNSIVTAFNKTGAGGTVTLYTSNSTSGTTVNEINNNNNFSNITVTGATTIVGWASTDGGTPVKTVTGNTFANWIGGTSAITGLNVGFSSAATVSNNNVNTISCACTLTGIASSSGTQTFSQNTVHTLSGTGTGTVTGISNTGGTTQIYSRNKVYNIENTNAVPVAAGITVSSGTTVTLQNNLVGDIRTPNSGSTNSLFGINISGGTTVNAFFNSVYLNATSVGANFGSSAINASTTPATTLRNNIFVNTSTAAGTGLAVAYRRSSATLSTYAAASNNNDFFASTIYTDGITPQATIAAYKALVASRDSGSFAENPAFVSTTGSSPSFLHINLLTPTQLESGGTTVAGITDDFDGDTRNVTTPDIGADEFIGMGLDMSPPVITYTNLGDTALLTNRVLSVSISDATGVASGSLSPRLYFKKSTDGSYVSTQCVLAASPNYNCTIDYSLVGGGSVAAGDTVQYFAVAQDTLGNLAANPSLGFVATDVNTVTTPPTAPNQYSVLASFTAPYTQDFETNSTGWSAGFTVGTASDWVFGTPAKTQIIAAHSGTKAWVTKLTGTYTTSTTSTLNSPIFNFSALTGRPTLSFWHNFKSEAGFDAGVVEFSTDGGTTWTKVDANLGTGGTFNTTDSTGWYNSSSTNGAATGVTPPKWSGTSTTYTGHAAGWVLASTLLPNAVVGQSDVRLRWRFGADSSTNDEGWAVDDVTIAPPNPGIVQFSSVSYSGNENTTATITVNRTGGNAGAIAVNYATSNGTATAGTCGTEDYVAASGTLNWADGDSVAKTFTVQLCSDAVLDPAETVNLTLSGATGGATIGANNPAVLTIGDVPPPFSGTYTVGSGGQFTSLTNAGGIFEAINNTGASGPVTINITSDLTGETGANPINPIAGNPAVLIKPSGGPRTISGVAPIAVIRINGADNIRIDGSTAASVVGGTPALRELTVQNLSTSTSSGVIHIGSATESSNNNTVKNVIAIGNDPLQTVTGISTGGATPTSTALFANNNTRIENCSIQKVQQGIFTRGVSQTTLNTGTVISENDLSATGANRVRTFGIFVGNEDGILISQNSIGGMDTTGTGTDTFGIAAGIGGISDTTATTTFGVTNAVISRNKINGVSQDGTFSAAGIAVAGIAGTNTLANNMVTGVISDGDGGDLTAGIFVTGVTGTTTKLYYNSVAMTGDRSALLTPSTAMNPSFGLAISGTDPIVELKNNIFYTSQIAATGGADATSYAIGTQSTTFVNLDSNYNAFFSTGANDGGFRSGSLDRAVDATTEVDYATLAAWQTAVTDDANSVEGDPLFVSPANNLHISASTALLVDKGIAVSVLDDFDGQTRSLVGFTGGIPDIGADEALAPTAATASVRGRLLTPTGRGLMNAYVDLTNTNTGEVKRVRSTSLGYFNFQDLATGNFYIISVQSKRYQFNTQSFTLEENLDGLVLTANDGQSK